jgi:hypothetical protein
LAATSVLTLGLGVVLVVTLPIFALSPTH